MNGHFPQPTRVDLTGVRCPLNWARAKAVLEDLATGDVVELLVDDPRARRDIPLAAETEGYCVVEVEERDGGVVRIVIER